MSKIFSILLIILTFFALQFTPLVKESYATEDCTNPSVGISYGNPLNGTINANTFFTENSGDLTLEFTIADNNVLKGKEVFLHLPGGVWMPGGGTDDKSTTSTTAVSPKFRLTIDKNYSQAQKGPHSAELWWPNPADPTKFTSFCWSVRYNIGVINDQCNILQGPPKELPTSSPITIIFLGRAKQEYELRKGTNILTKVTTDNEGVGKFENINVTGNPGDKFFFTLGTSTVRYACQTTEITITSAASPQSSVNPSASIIPVPAPTVKKCGDKDNNDNDNEIICAKGGGDPCGDTKDNRGPALKTAIGCIHTNPAELVKDLMKFVIGISGGLAFLMMLLGAFQMLTSAGNPETLAAGKGRITSAVIGLLMVIFAVLLLQIIGFDILKLPGFGR